MRREVAVLGLLGMFGSCGGDPPARPLPDVPEPLRAEEQRMLTHADDVASYTLYARLDPTAHQLTGKGTIAFRNRSSKDVNEVWVHLYLNAFKNNQSTFSREATPGFRGGGPVEDYGSIDVASFSLQGQNLWATAEMHPGGTKDETDVRVPLPSPLKPGASLQFEIAWDERLPSIVERTGHFGDMHMVAQWFPKLARLEADGSWAHFPFHHLGEFYADFGNYDVTIDVPDDVVVGATGVLKETQSAGGRRTQRYVQGDIHDFAFTAWSGWQSREEKIDSVDVRILYPRGYSDVAERELRLMRYALPYFGRRYGRYPYDVLTLVHPPAGAPEAGGMEYPTLITTGGYAFTPEAIREAEVVTVHEFAHQYFYGLLASDEVTWPFLDEGFTSFAEADAMGAMFGAGSIFRIFGLELSDDAANAVLGRRFVHDEKVAQPAYAFASGASYGSLIYSRTNSILTTLRGVYGEKFWLAFGTYARRYRFRHPTPEDFLGVMSEQLGSDVAAEIRRALFDKGWVDFAVEEVFSSLETEPCGVFGFGAERKTVACKAREPEQYVGWVTVARRGTLRFPVDVEYTLSNGERHRLRWDASDAQTKLPVRASLPIVSAVVDPDHLVPIDENFGNNAFTVDGARRSAPHHTLELSTALFEALLPVLGP